VILHYHFVSTTTLPRIVVPVKRLTTVEKAFRVLVAVSERQPIGLGELARSLDLDKAAVQRILATLGDLGWIAPAAPPATGWELTPEALVVGRRYAPELRGQARPHLEALQAGTGETTALVMVDRDRVVIVDTVDSVQPLRVTIPIGFEAPLSDFQPFLSFFPDADLDALAADGLVEVRLTPPQRAANRRRGWYLLEMDEFDVRAVGAPVVAPGGSVRAALLLVAPRTRLPRDRQVELGGQLRTAAATITAH
jgi:IclR family acetate operon transcriptional repressor